MLNEEGKEKVKKKEREGKRRLKEGKNCCYFCFVEYLNLRSNFFLR